MPVRSLRSSVLVWPDRPAVDASVRQWAEQTARQRPELLRVGYFGSYARGNWGVGSDLDLLLIVARADDPFERRAVRWDTTALPVPADVLVYTAAEWESVSVATAFGRSVSTEAVWVFHRAHAEPRP